MNVYKQNLLHLNNFLNYIENQRRYSVHTIRAYNTDLIQLIDYLGEDKKIINLNKYDLHEYVTSISKSISSKTLSRKIATLKSLFKFLCDEELINHNISKGIKIPKVGKRLPNHVSINEMKAFFKKTLEGSMAFLLSSIFIILSFSKISVYPAMISALITTLVESSKFLNIDDNLTVPLSFAAFYSFLIYFFNKTILMG